MNLTLHQRLFPIGAELKLSDPSPSVDFRVYAPRCHAVEVSLEAPQKENSFFLLNSEGNGYFSGNFSEFKEGDLYRFRLDGKPNLYADPASRFQPSGPFGPSQIINSKKFQWTDQDWKGIEIQNQIIYELHVGTFTEAGTFASAQKELQELKELGITLIEIMPLNEFPGKYGWGYDGVNLFSPTRLYGNPDEVRAFINEAHRLGMGVILDVVYNHFGPEGNFISEFSDEYFAKENNEWGKAINFDEAGSREFFLTNARYWIDEFHFDGLRVDATQAIISHTPKHFLLELQKNAREAAKDRKIVLIAENEVQDPALIWPEDKAGYGFDAVWNDDLHHSAVVCLTGRREAYYTDYKGKSQEFISALKYGFLYQGQYYTWQKKPRGANAKRRFPYNFVNFIENHDQIANSGHGKRLHQLTDQGNLKAMTALIILSRGASMLFQGQEFGSTRPFFYFADHSEDLTPLIDGGRKAFLSQFRNLATEEMQAALPNPSDPATFYKCKLDFLERQTNSGLYQMHKDLIQLRKNDPILTNHNLPFDGAALNDRAFLIRFFDEQDRDRLLLFNFGTDLILDPAPEPLLGPNVGTKWEILWSSESLAYNGQGTADLLENPIWKITGHSALVLALVPAGASQ